MLENLNFHFAFYDWLLVFMVTALGVFSAYTKDPQLKAVAATIPIPCGFAYIAVGLPMGAANAISGFMCLLYVHIVVLVPILVALDEFVLCRPRDLPHAHSPRYRSHVPRGVRI